MKASRKLWSWVPVVLYSGLIFYLSSGSVEGLPRPHVPGFDKVLHTGAFCLWSLLGALGVSATWPRLPGLWFVVLLTAGGAFYGMSDEFHQSFVPERQVEVLDWLADCLGAFSGAVAAALCRRWLRARAAGVKEMGSRPE